jgi:GMP synthase (glutamine-hydrolysing)
MYSEKILILDFGSQYTQLIARRVRELHVYAEIVPFNKVPEITSNIKGIILSGSPCSVNDADAPFVNIAELSNHLPILGICYGAQLMAKQMGGQVQPSKHREYGRAMLNIKQAIPFFNNTSANSQVWMSHGDSITSLPKEASITATTEQIPVAGFERSWEKNIWLGVQFHPEVYHSKEGLTFFKNFLFTYCQCKGDYSEASFIQSTIEQIKQQIGSQKVIMALSGGVDSTVAAKLIQEAIGDNLVCVFVNNGLLRKNEYEQVLASYKTMQFNIQGVDASNQFYAALKNQTDPEAKRKAIGKTFIDVFVAKAKEHTDAAFLGQGTIYPDVIESVSVHGPSVTIKSHHNVGGLPSHLPLTLCEPIRPLFKDEVRRVGKALGIDDAILSRHPFPGPGLGIRILGEITGDKIKLLQEADDIFTKALKQSGQYNKVWQAGAILLPVQSVGVMGDERTYEYTLALRAVTSVDGMTADWAHLPYELLAQISNDIINKVRGINRVVYDISSKPPATIEWE